MRAWQRWLTHSPFRTAAVVAALAAVACVVILWRGLHPDPVGATTSTSMLAPGGLLAPVPARSIDVAAATEADLFASNRNAPPERYHLPAELAAKTAILGSAPIEVPKPVVLGTAIAADGASFATCQYQSDRLLMVRVGDHVGGFVVRSIARDRVVFAAADGKLLEVLAPRAGS